MSYIIRRLYTVALGAVILPFVSLSALESKPKQVVDSLHLEERLAPDFELKDIDGKEYKLDRFADSLPVLIWFTNLCEGCRSNIPALDSVYLREIRPKAELLAISLLGDDFQTVEMTSNELNYSFPMLIDPDGASCKDYIGTYVRASCPISNLFVIDRHGMIRYESHFPGLSLKEVIELLKELSNKSTDKLK